MIIVTTDAVHGREIKEVFGLVKGTSVRSKNIGADFGAGLKNIVGGELSGYTKLQDESRKMAMSRMVEDARSKNNACNAIVGVRLVSSQIAQGASEITVYGTAVLIED